MNSVCSTQATTIYNIPSVGCANPSRNYGVAVTPVSKVAAVSQHSEPTTVRVELPAMREGANPQEMAVRARMTAAETEERDMTINGVEQELSPEETLKNHAFLVDNLSRASAFQTTFDQLSTVSGAVPQNHGGEPEANGVIEDMLETIKKAENANFPPVETTVLLPEQEQGELETQTEQADLSAKFSIQSEEKKGELMDRIG